MSTEQLRALRDAAHTTMDRAWCDSAIAALKAQEPQTPLQLAAAACRAVGMLEGHSDEIAESVRRLAVRMKDYADTHIPLAQHEAALAEARREERERCAKVCEGLSDLDLYVRESSALMEAGAAIRALRDGGEG